ncbi:hypothetical protein [Motilimonas eburnea]|uniref:hypothetical protein n=1 Tax=Motilimonas eburnea TaxID=1737488 RepID=UPI001E29911F|nr:hypothetical protein [Motilimonas eburnea]MCE2572494.1 hypothetical protein [Motilimonas eburnea]
MRTLNTLSRKQLKTVTLCQPIIKLIENYPEAMVLNLTKHRFSFALPSTVKWLDINIKGKERLSCGQVINGNLEELSWLKQLNKTTNQKIIILVSENKKHSFEQLTRLLDELIAWAPCIDLLIDKQLKANMGSWPVNDLHHALELIDVTDIDITKSPRNWVKQIRHWLGSRTHYQVYHYGSINF